MNDSDFESKQRQAASMLPSQSTNTADAADDNKRRDNNDNISNGNGNSTGHDNGNGNDNGSCSSDNTNSDGDGDDGFMGWDHNQRRRKSKSTSTPTSTGQKKSKSKSKSSNQIDSNQNHNHNHNHNHNKNKSKNNNKNHLLNKEQSNFSFDSNSDQSESNSDSNQSISESDSDGDDSSDSEEETKWSLNIKLNSVVDLPSSILPNVPTCPILKFGLLTIHDPLQLKQMHTLSAKARRKELEQSQDELMKVLPLTSLRLESGVLRDFQCNTSLAACCASLLGDNGGNGGNGNGNGQQQQTIASIVKSSSGKIMSLKDNGMMEWHEEMRWDQITSPLQTVLAIELVARPIFPCSNNSLGSYSRSNMSSSKLQREGSHRISEQSREQGQQTQQQPQQQQQLIQLQGQLANTNSSFDEHGYYQDRQQQQQQHSFEDSGTGDGPGGTNQNAILGLWRKGRRKWGEQQRKRRSGVNYDGNGEGTDYQSSGPASLNNSFVSTGSNSASADANTGAVSDELNTANKAAAVARHLMNDNDANANVNVNVNATIGVNANQYSVQSEGANAGDSITISISKSQIRDVSRNRNVYGPGSISILEHTSLADGDLRLGTLLIPISNLPLEDEIPRVEKWYQFDTQGYSGVNANGNASANGNANGNGNGGVNGNSNTRAGESLNPAPWRDPTVLLDISLCTTSTLNRLEDEMYAVAGGTTGGTPEKKGASAPFAEDSYSSHSVKTKKSSARVPPSQEQSTANTELREFSSDASHVTGTSVTRARGGSFDVKSPMSQDGKLAETQRLEEQEIIEQNGPYLQPGIVDYICVVGPKDIGNTKLDTGEKGWISSEPECCVLEQFPSNEFHHSNGRKCVLPEGIEWWCFPEGCKLWRGSEPPSHMDMNLKRFSAASPPRMASSVAAFDACLNCTTSFMWWVLSSNSDVYGSSISKTYGAVIRFYAQVPGTESNSKNSGRKNLPSDKMWCPLGICLTSSMPIVGILEAVLLRLCEKLASTGGAKSWEGPKSIVHSDIMDLILNYQRPMPGVVNCSIPFLSGDGDRLHVSLPPYGCLPPLPHGASVTSVCRLLGAEGLTALLAAVLTECKILVHSADVANLAMVGEVITALMCPFTWQLPCIPVLPLSMITFVEAPVSYFIGVPSCNMKFVDKDALIDVVVIDLDNGFSSPDYFNGRRNHDSSLSTPLPASVSSNISKAIFKLLREEEEVHEQYGTSAFSGSRHLSRLEGESLAERDFRIAVAHQVCGLIRGYQECLFFVSACQPVFNRDRFLRQAPALFEERRGMSPSTSSSSVPSTTSASFKKIISPRSKRFLSGLVNSQHFHALLEMLDHESNAFFHDIMDTFQDEADDGSAACSYGSAKQRSVIATLRASLDASEQVVPTYHAHNQRLDDLEEESEDFDFIGGYFSSFTTNLLQPVKKVSTPAVTPSEDTPGDSTILSTAPKTSKSSIEVDEDDESIRKMSLKDLVELDKIPWVYKKIFDIDMKPSSTSEKSKLWKKIHLKEALGENKFNEWKAEQESKDIDDELEDDVGDGISSGMKRPLKSSLDLTKLISNIRSDEVPNRNFVSKLERCIASDRAVIKRYIEKAYEIVEELKEGLLEVDQVEEQFDDINAEVDAAMKNPSAQRFLMSVLSQRSRLQNENRRIDNRAALRPGYRIEVSTSNLHPLVFDCLHRLCSAMLEACHHEYDYEAAYKLLIHTTGFCTADENMMVCYMTKQIVTHKIYGDLRLWDRVLLIHQQDRQRDKNVNETKATRAESAENDEYEATVSTLYEMLGYGMPADDLARFTYRVANEKFYSTDKEQKLLTLARRLAVKCDEAAPEEDIESDDGDQSCESKFENVTVDHGKDWQWEELNWTHPGSGGAYTDQAPITGLASFGGSIIATGALDGSVYLASTLHLDKEKRGKIGGQFVRGVQLLWPSTPPLASGSGGQQDIVSNGAISCLVAIQGSDHHKKKSSSINSDGAENDSEAFSIEGCRLVGGTTGGNLAVWDIPNAMEEVFAGELADGFDNLTSLISDVKIHNSGTQSSNVRGASSPAAYNKRSNKDKTGVSLGGHRGGVTCLAVPSQIYRPDSLISGGNDGLIKFWSLRTRPEARQSNRRQTMGGRTSRMLFSNNEKALGKDTLDVLAGHGGRILCVEVAWHGDRLLSGAADRTVKLWDLASQSGGRCLQTMHGHTSGVTHGRYWGRNTIVSASSDRSIALWDTRSGSSPLFVLRYHNGPISDLYLESRTSFWMTSAGNDGTIGTWDFRMMKTMNGDMDSGKPVIRAQTIRYPLAQMCHANQSSGPVHLGRGVGTKFGQGERSVMSVGVDNIIKQWDALNGALLDEHRISSRSKVSCFKSFAAGENLIRGQTDRDGVIASLKLGGTITTSWDGTVRLRRLCLG